MALVVVLPWAGSPAPARARATPGSSVASGSTWPDVGARLAGPEPAYPAGFGVRRVALDPGHGARDNTGNLSAFCEDEQDYTLRLARAVAARLERGRHFEVRLTRPDDRPVEYEARVAAAAAWGAEAFVSLHSDVRGHRDSWSPAPGQTCPRAEGSTGFAVLVSDEGEDALQTGRLEFARLLAAAMLDTGFVAYDGSSYEGLYAHDAAQRGVFLDRHEEQKRIFVLRRTRMPAVLVETHNALDPTEAARWNERDAVDALASALARALVGLLAPA